MRKHLEKYLGYNISISSISVHSLSRVQLFATPWIAVRQASLSITTSWSLLKLMSIEMAMPSNHLILCCPLLLPPSIIPNIRVFSNFYVKYCWKFLPWGMGAGGRKGVSFLLPVCIPISLSHTQVHLSLNHPQARTFQCCDLPQNKDVFLNTKLRSDCQINQVARSLDCVENFNGKCSILLSAPPLSAHR